MGARGEGQEQPPDVEPDQGWAAMAQREPGHYWTVVGLLVRVTLMFLVWPSRTILRVTLSPTERSRTWATREREPSIDSPSTSVTESPTRNPAVSAKGEPQKSRGTFVAHKSEKCCLTGSASVNQPRTKRPIASLPRRLGPL